MTTYPALITFDIDVPTSADGVNGPTTITTPGAPTISVPTTVTVSVASTAVTVTVPTAVAVFADDDPPTIEVRS